MGNRVWFTKYRAWREARHQRAELAKRYKPTFMEKVIFLCLLVAVVKVTMVVAPMQMAGGPHDLVSRAVD